MIHKHSHQKSCRQHPEPGTYDVCQQFDQVGVVQRLALAGSDWTTGEQKEAVRASSLALRYSAKEFTMELRESTWVCIIASASGCEEGTESAGGGKEAEGLLLCLERSLDSKDLRNLSCKRTSSSGHSMHSSQRESREQ